MAKGAALVDMANWWCVEGWPLGALSGAWQGLRGSGAEMLQFQPITCPCVPG